MKSVFIIAIVTVVVVIGLITPVFAEEIEKELDDLKKFIPDYYNIDEARSGGSDAGKIIRAISETGAIHIFQYVDENMMWEMFKQQKKMGTFVNEITSFPATCYEMWDSDGRFKTVECIKDDLLIVVSTIDGESDSIMKQIFNKMDKEISLPNTGNSKGGGCLIATATYGSEMSQQVQQLRELRDNQLLQTESGSAFMETFNDIYYSFSPIIADMEREHPLFKEAVKLAITPMISTLSLMENANSESKVLGMGLSVIMLNIGMYLGVPAIVVIGIRKRI